MGETNWTAEDLRRLYAALKGSIPEKSTHDVYSDVLKAVDWEKVAFPPFSSAQCKDKWTTVCYKLRKTRSLTELIVQAEVNLESEMPKMPPRNGYQLFCQEQGPLMAGVVNRGYVKVWGQRWHELSEDQKNKYNVRCRKLKRKYAAQMKDCNLDQDEQKGHKRQKLQKKRQHREAKITKQHDREEHCPDRPLDSEDEKLSSSEEEGEQMDYDDEKEDDEGGVIFDIY